MKLLHRPAHTISPALHREAWSRASRWRLVLLGGVIGGLLTCSGTAALERINRELARGHHDAVAQQQWQSRAAHTRCLGMLSDAHHFITVPAIATARCRRIAQALPSPARTACLDAITATRFTTNVIEQRAACVRPRRVTR